MILGVIIGLIFGAALFFALAKFKGTDDASKRKKLEEEYGKYRKKVDDHFVNTAVLLKGLTDQYRDVYRHIASGAGELCSEEAKALQTDLEETALLAAQPVKKFEASETNKVDHDVKEPEGVTEDEIPLVSKAEVSAELAEENKSTGNK